MKQILKYIISITLAVSIPFIIQAQNKGKKFLPTQVKVGTDLSYLGLSILSEDRNQYELNTDIDFYRFFVAGDFGIADYALSDSNYNYSNSGSYYRLGIDYNLLKKNLEKYALYVGVKYSASSYSEDFEYSVNDPVYGNYTEEISEVSRNSYWFELSLGMKVRVWKGVFLGWTGRFKFINSVSTEPSSFSNYWIPGYGKAANDSMWGLNYQIFYQIPIRKRGPSEIIEKEEEITDSN